MGDKVECRVNCKVDTYLYRTDCEYSNDDEIASNCCAAKCDDFKGDKIYFTNGK